MIKSTNRQNPVKTEELNALTDFQKELESYYAAISDDSKRLYYERRSNQYASMEVDKIRIVSISNQIKSFSSMFLDLPHLSGRYYGTLLKEVDKKIFIDGHPMNCYYASSYMNYKLDSLLRRKAVDRKFWTFKHQIMFIVRYLILGNESQAFQSNKFKKKIDDLIEVLWDESTLIPLINDACDLILKAAGAEKAGVELEKDLAKTVGLTKSIKAHIESR